MSRRDDALLALRAGRSLVRAGVLRPLPPGPTIAVVEAARRHGTSIGAACAINAARTPDAPALVDDEGTLTWAQLDARASAIATRLEADRGVGRDRGVAIMCRNHRGFAEALVAAGQLGADALLLNTEFPAPQVAQALGRHEPGVVVCDEALADRLADDAPLVTERDLETFAAGGGRPTVRAPRPGKVTLLSSGTTGAPKGAGRAPSLLALLGPLVTMLDALRLRRGDPVFVGPPLFHGFGLSFLTLGLTLGCPVLLRRRFDADAALATMAEHRAACFVGVPVMLQRMLDAHDGTPLPHLRAVVSAAAPLPGHLSDAFMDAFGDLLFNAYGSTETGFGALAGPADLRAAPGTIGRAPAGGSVRILDAEHRPAPTGDVGHIFVGGRLVFDGYDGGGSKEVVDGHMNTGDLGHVDEAGRIFVDGREDDMIVSGGENVFPQEVEETLATHPAVADVTVVGVPDDEFGQRLRAFVVGGPQEPSAEELLAHVRASLARYKVPRDVVFVDEIPRTPTGKVLRREMIDSR